MGYIQSHLLTQHSYGILLTIKKKKKNFSGFHILLEIWMMQLPVEHDVEYSMNAVDLMDNSFKKENFKNETVFYSIRSFIHSIILLLIDLPTLNISGAQMVPTYGIIQAYSRLKDMVQLLQP